MGRHTLPLLMSTLPQGTNYLHLERTLTHLLRPLLLMPPPMATGQVLALTVTKVKTPATPAEGEVPQAVAPVTTKAPPGEAPAKPTEGKVPTISEEDENPHTTTEVSTTAKESTEAKMPSAKFPDKVKKPAKEETPAEAPTPTPPPRSRSRHPLKLRGIPFMLKSRHLRPVLQPVFGVPASV